MGGGELKFETSAQDLPRKLLLCEVGSRPARPPCRAAGSRWDRRGDVRSRGRDGQQQMYMYQLAFKYVFGHHGGHTEARRSRGASTLRRTLQTRDICPSPKQ